MVVVPAPVMCAHWTGLIMEGAVLERQLIRRITEVEFNVLLLSVFFR